MTPIGPLQAAGFLLASYAVIGNDALQTLGTFLAGNRGRTPKLLQAIFLCAVLCGFLLLGWSLGGGDPAWGRLSSFALPERFGWADLLPPIVVLALTQWGAPVSTSFLVLTAFGPSNLPGLLVQSLAGYGAAFVVGALLYGSLPWLLDPPSGTSGTDEPPDSMGRPILWLWLQWTATGWLWGQWLIQDLANIYVYLPRRLTGMEMAASLTVLCAGVGLLVARDGGAIQRVLACKTDSDDPRSSTLITALYGLVLFAFARISTVPMSTTWVFLGLLAGREMGLLLRLGLRPATQVGSDLGRDLLRAGLGLVVSVGVALSIPTLKGLG